MPRPSFSSPARSFSCSPPRTSACSCAAVFSLNVTAQWCPEKNIQYWQGFPPGGESDQSARQQQLVLKRKCPGIETIVQYKPGASGGLMWSQMNSLPGDGYNIVGVTLPHIVLQPMEGQVQSAPENEKKKLQEKLNRVKEENPPFEWALAVRDRGGKPLPTHILVRGNAASPAAGTVRFRRYAARRPGTRSLR